MVCSIVSTHYQHHCMPVTAEFDLPYWCRTKCSDEDALAMREKRNQSIAELKILEDAIINTIPKNQWHGAKRWHRALNG